MTDHRQNVLIVMSQEAADTFSRIAASMPFETLCENLGAAHITASLPGAAIPPDYGRYLRP
jgi:hypothetical protein